MSGSQDRCVVRDPAARLKPSICMDKSLRFGFERLGAGWLCCFALQQGRPPPPPPTHAYAQAHIVLRWEAG